MYKSLKDCAIDLEKHGKLRRIPFELDPDLEIAEVHRRVFEAGGPALWFEKVKGSPFSALSNLYGTYERTDFIFRKEIQQVQKVIELKLDPALFLKKPVKYASAPLTALTSLPLRVNKSLAPILYGETSVGQLPQIKSWPLDGGAFVTLPQVYSEDPEQPGVMHSNIGMYRIQLSGNNYIQDKEIGLHYQLHRGIGVHHSKYNRLGAPFKVSVFIGGPPSHALSAIFPLPEGLSETLFAGMLNGRRFRYVVKDGFTLSSDADFVITGTVRKNEKKPEGPFGDHLGYYSLRHDFPVMDVHKVFHRKDPIFHFTVVGRPPQEDSSFGYMIHNLVASLATQEFPGLKEMNAVDAAGVHPLLLAIGSERYMPFRERRPEEILTIANRILGSGQTSLSKFLFIAAWEDDPALTTKDLPRFFNHILERVDWSRDLHFQTKTTIDTLDYSGSGWNGGSKLVVACCGPQKRTLTTALPENFGLPNGFSKPIFVQPGVLAVQGPSFPESQTGYEQAEFLCRSLEGVALDSIPLIVLCDDSAFMAASVNNFVWATFTRTNPSHDVHGVGSFVEHKHWGCKGPLVVDARIKPQHAPALIPDKKVKEKVDKLFSRSGPLKGVI